MNETSELSFCVRSCDGVGKGAQPRRKCGLGYFGDETVFFEHARVVAQKVDYATENLWWEVWIRHVVFDQETTPRLSLHQENPGSVKS